MITGNRTLIQAAVLLLSFYSSIALAATEAGKILYARGVVSLIDEQDASRGGKSGSILYEGDRVVTGRGALAQLRLSDGALIALRGSSDYKIEKQSYGEDESLYEQAGKLFTGWMRSITGTIGQKYPQKVSQSTSVATIGIRGTVYQIISIPPEGLPGFAGEAPGTYVLLEEGSVEITTEAGKRTLKPGDVVFVPEGGGAPQLMPEKGSLFEDAEQAVIQFGEIDDEDFSKALNDGLTDLFGGEPDPGPDPFSNVYMVGRNDQGSYSTIIGAETYDVTGFTTSGTGASRILTQMSMVIEGEALFTAQAPAPTNAGYHQFASGGEVIWGVWGAGTYEVDDGTGFIYTGNAPWLYMLASNQMTLANVTSLTGTATYTYAGGTGLWGGSSFTQIDSGSINVDFTAQEMVVNLTISDGATNTWGLSNADATFDGQRGISTFYSSGLSIIDDPANTFVSGTIGGAFVSEGDGIATHLTVNETSVGTSEGTALFVK